MVLCGRIDAIKRGKYFGEKVTVAADLGADRGLQGKRPVAQPRPRAIESGAAFPGVELKRSRRIRREGLRPRALEQRLAPQEHVPRQQDGQQHGTEQRRPLLPVDLPQPASPAEVEELLDAATAEEGKG